MPFVICLHVQILRWNLFPFMGLTKISCVRQSQIGDCLWALNKISTQPRDIGIVFATIVFQIVLVYLFSFVHQLFSLMSLRFPVSSNSSSQ